MDIYRVVVLLGWRVLIVRMNRFRKLCKLFVGGSGTMIAYAYIYTQIIEIMFMILMRTCIWVKAKNCFCN